MREECKRWKRKGSCSWSPSYAVRKGCGRSSYAVCGEGRDPVHPRWSTHREEMDKWVGRVGGDGGCREDEPERCTDFRKKHQDQPHISKTRETAMRGIMSPGPCVWGDLFLFSKNTTACLPVRVGGGKAEKVYRVDWSGFIMFAWRF